MFFLLPDNKNVSSLEHMLRFAKFIINIKELNPWWVKMLHIHTVILFFMCFQVEMKIKVLEAKHQEEKLKMQQTHDADVEKVRIKTKRWWRMSAHYTNIEDYYIFN